jgi:hypothetical protein
VGCSGVLDNGARHGTVADGLSWDNRRPRKKSINVFGLNWVQERLSFYIYVTRSVLGRGNII